MNSIIAIFFCVAIATASCSVFGYAGPLDGGAVLKGPTAGATVTGPSGTISATSDSGAVGVAPSFAGVYGAGAVVAPVPAVVPHPPVVPAGPVVVEARAAPWSAPGVWGAAPWAPAVRGIW